MILVDGKVDGALDATDRGLAYGDGVFRTLILEQGVPRAWTQHHEKLRRDCAALSIDCPSEAVLRDDLEQIARSTPDCVVKIIVTRGATSRGYVIAQPPPAAVRIMLSSPVPAYPEEYSRFGVRARCCALRLAAQPALAGIKHLNRLENVLARMEWDDPGIAEGLMLDGAAYVIGGTMSNLFIVEDGTLVTPDLARCGVEGVTRGRVLEAAARRGIPWRVEPIDMTRLYAAQEVFLVNSLIGVWAVRELEGRSWQIGPMSVQAKCWLNEKLI
jgi:4-amino-4-deoxychorismate lyase